MKSGQFDPHSKINRSSLPRHKNEVNFDLDTKTKCFSTPHKNQVNADPYTGQIKSSSIPHT